MTSRYRIFIITALVCHVFLTTSKVISQLPPGSPPHKSVEKPLPKQLEDATISAVTQEKLGDQYTLTGNATVQYHGFTLRADTMTYNRATNHASAEGHVVLEGADRDEHLEATRAEYNLKTGAGRFYDVVGRVGAHANPNAASLTTSAPFTVTGKMIERTEADRYWVHQGTVTTCEAPKPKWTFSAGLIGVDLGGSAVIHNGVFHIRGVPVVYFPYATHPIQNERQSGLLIPSIGQSSVKGTVIGDSLYWAINRSADATLGAEYYSARGWSQHGSVRWRPSDTSVVDLSYFGVLDRKQQGGENAKLKAEGQLPWDFRGVANIDYLSSFVFRLAFSQVFSQAIDSEVKSSIFASRSHKGYSVNFLTSRYQNFQSSTNNSDVIDILHLPSLEFSSFDRPLGKSPVVWSLEAAAEGLHRGEPGFTTGNVGRFDAQPAVALPLHWKGWDLRPELSVRGTAYTERLVPSNGVGVAADSPITRKALEADFEIAPPALSRVSEHEYFGRRFKHVIEPRLTYRYVTGVDNFSNLLRFDARDVLTNTNEVEYSVTQRLYAKRTTAKPEECGPRGVRNLSLSARVPTRGAWVDEDKDDTGCSGEPTPAVREVLTWTLGQKYFVDPTFGGALVNGVRNVFTTTVDFAGIGFLTDERRFAPLISRVHFQPSGRTEAEWNLDYDFKKGRISSSTALVNVHFGNFAVGGSDVYLRAPGEIAGTKGTIVDRFHQFRVLLGYGYPNKRGLSAATNIGFDANLGFLQYAAGQTSYNWDCCGVNFEYRRFALGSVRNENQYRFSFSLANIGAFGNLKRQERLY